MQQSEYVAELSCIGTLGLALHRYSGFGSAFSLALGPVFGSVFGSAFGSGFVSKFHSFDSSRSYQ